MRPVFPPLLPPQSPISQDPQPITAPAQPILRGKDNYSSSHSPTELPPTYLQSSAFVPKKGMKTGGVTGSMPVVDAQGQLYQFKPSIKDNSLFRRLSAGGLDSENYGEIIGSHLGKALVPSSKGIDLVPEVSLVYEPTRGRTAAVSRYLSNAPGSTQEVSDLDGYAKSNGMRGAGQRHVQVSFNGESGPSQLGLAKEPLARADLYQNIGLSALLGDHDVNPANMMALHDAEGNLRIGRIDFGHAFNDLVTAPSLLGGGIKTPQNRILDFINREQVAHLLPSKRQSKLWRDYQGMGPSAELSDAFRSLSSMDGHVQGLAQAKGQFLGLVAELDARGDTAGLQHIKESLAKISQKTGQRVDTSQAAGQVVKDVFNNLNQFVAKGQSQMADVAELSDLQARIDQALTLGKKGGTLSERDRMDIHQRYADVAGRESLLSSKGTGINWMKTGREEKAFTGNLSSYIQSRAKALGLTTNEQRTFMTEQMQLPFTEKQSFLDRLLGRKPAQASPRTYFDTDKLTDSINAQVDRSLTHLTDVSTERMTSPKE